MRKIDNVPIPNRQHDRLPFLLLLCRLALARVVGHIFSRLGIQEGFESGCVVERCRCKVLVLKMFRVSCVGCVNELCWRRDTFVTYRVSLAIDVIKKQHIHIYTYIYMIIHVYVYMNRPLSIHIEISVVK